MGTCASRTALIAANMSNKARGFGLTAELDRKKAEKFDADRANEVIEWLRELLKVADAKDPDIETLVEVATMQDVCKVLKDGRVLAKAMNILYPGTIKKINKIDNPNSPFKKTKEEENISNFLKGCKEKAGCLAGDVFEIVDLYEMDNIPTVVDGLYALGRKIHHHADPNMPALGPKEADKNEREFTEEQLAAGKNIIGLQMGTNECASQAGQSFGKTRAIID